MAITGIRSAAATRDSASTPTAAASACVALAQTGPKMTKSAPSISARLAASTEWTERPISPCLIKPRANSIPMSSSGRFTPEAPAARAISHRELITTGNGDDGTKRTASRSNSRALSPGARSWRMVARRATRRPASALETIAMATGVTSSGARCPRSASSGLRLRAWGCVRRDTRCGRPRRPP